MGATATALAVNATDYDNRLKTKEWNIGASYDFEGVVKAFADYFNRKIDGKFDASVAPRRRPACWTPT